MVSSLCTLSVYQQVVADIREMVMQTAAARKDMYVQRRQSIRDTWLPALAALPNVAYSFVVSRPYDKTVMQDIREEERTLGGPFMVLETEVCMHHACTMHAPCMHHAHQELFADANLAYMVTAYVTVLLC